MGELLLEEKAPALWARVREIASRLGTKAPDHIIVGIDARFYVTEHDIWLDGQQISGRSLFVSLPLLKVLDVEQADAVLGHEMAHFSGEDTTWSRKIGPLLQRIEIYLAHLAQGVLSLAVFHFLHFFWKLYQFSFGKMSRAREFRADRIGAEISSSAALAGSLVKVGAYCKYREKTEEEIMLREGTTSRPEMALRLEQGFPSFLSRFAKNPQFLRSEISHPFDTHPSLRDRIQALGFTMAGTFADPALQAAVSRSWRDAISDAVSIEERMWSKQEQLMMDVREINCSMSIMPETEEDWNALRARADELIKAGALLMLPGLKVNDLSVVPPDFQYSPAEIEQLVQQDPGLWRNYAERMQTTVLQLMEAIDRRDLVAYTELGPPINQACEGCHGQYWYRPMPR
jgi:Zn-dependent protease with chaperone function